MTRLRSKLLLAALIAATLALGLIIGLRPQSSRTIEWRAVESNVGGATVIYPDGSYRDEDD